MVRCTHALTLHLPPSHAWVSLGQMQPAVAEQAAKGAQSGLHLPELHTGVAGGHTQVFPQAPAAGQNFCSRGQEAGGSEGK